MRIAAAFPLTIVLACATMQPVVLPVPGFYQELEWSHDGRRISYSMMQANRWSVYVAAADGSGARRVSPEDQNCLWSTWSPDGKQIAFGCGSKGKSDIWIAELSSGARHQLTTDGRTNTAPSWSPGGSRIAFTTRSGEHQVIMTVAPDGTSPVRLTPESSNAWNPVFSPDGRSVVYYSDAAGGDQLFVVDAEGRSIRPAGVGNQHEIFPAWTPAGDIVATLDRTAVVIRDRKVITTIGPAYFARISPNGRYIALISGNYPKSTVTIEKVPSRATGRPTGMGEPPVPPLMPAVLNALFAATRNSCPASADRE